MFHSSQHQLTNDIMFKENYDDIRLKCLEKQDVDKSLIELHDGPTRVNFTSETTTHKILISRYYFPMVFKNPNAYVQK
jgi:hypothetical protein